MELLTQYGVKVEINTTPEAQTATYEEVDKGFNNLEEQLNEVVNEYYYLGDKGFGTSEVTGMHPAIVLSGVRVLGDPVQDFIFGKKYGLMSARKTDIKISITEADNSVTTVACPITLTNLKAFGGGTTDGAAVEATLSFEGQPTVTTT